MIYTVTFNPSLDYIVSVKEFSTGTINRTVKEQIFPGGKGMNVSMVLKNLGYESTALGFLAGFTGDSIKRLLEEKGVKADFIFVKEGLSRINVKLRSVSAADSEYAGETFALKEETEINGQGPKISPEDVKNLYAKLDMMQDGDILVLAGSIPSSMPESAYQDILQYLLGKDIKVVVDATKDLLKNVLPYHPFLIKPNHHELGELFGVELVNRKDVVPYTKELQQQGARNVLVSMADKGAVLVTEDGVVYETAAPKGNVKNSVGAGDSMVAGFLAGYVEKGDYAEAFKMGVCTGSASAFSEEFATYKDVEALYNSFIV